MTITPKSNSLKELEFGVYDRVRDSFPNGGAFLITALRYWHFICQNEALLFVNFQLWLTELEKTAHIKSVSAQFAKLYCQ